jgi:hypothetical protein
LISSLGDDERCRVELLGIDRHNGCAHGFAHAWGSVMVDSSQNEKFAQGLEEVTGSLELRISPTALLPLIA